MLRGVQAQERLIAYTQVSIVGEERCVDVADAWIASQVRFVAAVLSLSDAVVVVVYACVHA